jgi:hypothetical protein
MANQLTDSAASDHIEWNGQFLICKNKMLLNFVFLTVYFSDKINNSDNAMQTFCPDFQIGLSKKKGSSHEMIFSLHRDEPFFGKKFSFKKNFSRAYDPSILRVTHADVFIEKSIKNFYQFILVLHQSLSKYEETNDT